MSDSEEDHSSGNDNEDLDDGPSTSWGGRRNAGQKRKILSDSDDEEPGAESGGEDDSDEEDDGPMEGEDMDSDSDGSSTPGAETCAICLGRMKGQVGSPVDCEHTFCLDCILEWAKTNATCPQDRKPFDVVLVRSHLGGTIEKRIPVKKVEEEAPYIPEEIPTFCEVCNLSDREDRLLLCDGCDLGYHLECLEPPLSQVPVEEWFCPTCVGAGVPRVVTNRQQQTSEPRVRQHTSHRSRSRSTSEQPRQPRLIPRTGASERVRRTVQRQRHKKRLKRKKRRQRKKAKIESGELEDKRPAVKKFSRFSVFEKEECDVDAQFADDVRAEQLLSGTSHQAARFPGERKADAVRRIRDAAFTPQVHYSGKASTSIMQKIKEEDREDDVLSGILQNQSIALSSSKKLTLTNDRKLTKQPGLENEPPCPVIESLVMSEPLASKKASSPKPDDAHRPSMRRDRSASPPRRPYRPHSPSPRRPYQRPRPQSPLMRLEEPVSSDHRSPLEGRRRSPPRVSYQRQGGYQNTWDRRNNRRDWNSDYHRREDNQRRSWRDRSDSERSDKFGAREKYQSYNRNQSKGSNVDNGHQRSRKEESPGRRYNKDSQRNRDPPQRDTSPPRTDPSPPIKDPSPSRRDQVSPQRKDKSLDKDGSSHRRRYSPDRDRRSHDHKERNYKSHRSYIKESRRSRSRSRSRERDSRVPSGKSRERKSRSHWGFSYFQNTTGTEETTSDKPSSTHSVHSIHSVHSMHSIHSMHSVHSMSKGFSENSGKDITQAQVHDDIMALRSDEEDKASCSTGNNEPHRPMESGFYSDDMRTSPDVEQLEEHEEKRSPQNMDTRNKSLEEFKITTINDYKLDSFKEDEDSDDGLYCFTKDSPLNQPREGSFAVKKKDIESFKEWNVMEENGMFSGVENKQNSERKDKKKTKKSMSSLFGDDQDLAKAPEKERSRSKDKEDKKTQEIKEVMDIDLFGYESEEETTNSKQPLPKPEESPEVRGYFSSNFKVKESENADYRNGKHTKNRRNGNEENEDYKNGKHTKEKRDSIEDGQNYIDGKLRNERSEDNEESDDDRDEKYTKYRRNGNEEHEESKNIKSKKIENYKHKEEMKLVGKQRGESKHIKERNSENEGHENKHHKSGKGEHYGHKESKHTKDKSKNGGCRERKSEHKGHNKEGKSEMEGHSNKKKKQLKCIDLFAVESDEDGTPVTSPSKHEEEGDLNLPSKGFMLKKKSQDSIGRISSKEQMLKAKFMAGLAGGLFGKSAPMEDDEDLLGDFGYSEVAEQEDTVSHKAKEEVTASQKVKQEGAASHKVKEEGTTSHKIKDKSAAGNKTKEKNEASNKTKEESTASHKMKEESTASHKTKEKNEASNKTKEESTASHKVKETSVATGKVLKDPISKRDQLKEGSSVKKEHKSTSRKKHKDDERSRKDGHSSDLKELQKIRASNVCLDLFGDIADVESSPEDGAIAQQKDIVDDIVKNYKKDQNGVSKYKKEQKEREGEGIKLMKKQSSNVEKDSTKKQSSSVEKDYSKKQSSSVEKDYAKKQSSSVEKDFAKKQSSSVEKDYAKKQSSSVEKDYAKKQSSSVEKDYAKQQSSSVEKDHRKIKEATHPEGESNKKPDTEVERKELSGKERKNEEVSISSSSSYQPSASATSKKENEKIKQQQKVALEVKVVKEIKKFLDPYYRDKVVTKDEYKEIVAKCVNKVVSAECGDVIETEKMRGLVEGYVKFYKHRKTRMQLNVS